MLNSGDVVSLDLGLPTGREAGYRHPAIVVTAQAVLEAGATVVQVVPLTSTLRGFTSEVTVEADAHNGLDRDSAAQCQHVRAVSRTRIDEVRGNVGPARLAAVRDVIGLILDIH